VSEIVRARVEERLTRLRLGSAASRLDAILSQAARNEPTYLDFLDGVLGDELDASGTLIAYNLIGRGPRAPMLAWKT
jgi:hypothetical protein